MLLYLGFEVLDVQPVVVGLDSAAHRLIRIGYLQHRQISGVFHQHDVTGIDERFEHEVDTLLSAADDEYVVGGRAFYANGTDIVGEQRAQLGETGGQAVLQHARKRRRRTYIARYLFYALGRQTLYRGIAARETDYLGIGEQLEYLSRRRSVQICHSFSVIVMHRFRSLVYLQ